MSDERTDANFTQLAHSLMPFTRVLGIEVIEAEPTRVRARAEWSPDRCTTGGVMHGGYLIAVADSTAAACAGLHLPEGASTTTIESKTNFIRPVRDGEIVIESTAVHVGRRQIVLQTDIVRPDGKLVARTTQTQAVIGPE